MPGRRSILLLAFAGVALAQKSAESIAEDVVRKGCLVLDQSGVKVCAYNYRVDGRAVEAFSFQPPGTGAFPGILMIPGFQRTAVNLIPLGVRLAAEGFAGVAVTQPGFGKSQGPADFVGPGTLKVLTTAYRKFQQEPFVDPKRMGIYGYSRGAWRRRCSPWTWRM